MYGGICGVYVTLVFVFFEKYGTVFSGAAIVTSCGGVSSLASKTIILFASIYSAKKVPVSCSRQ